MRANLWGNPFDATDETATGADAATAEAGFAAAAAAADAAAAAAAAANISERTAERGATCKVERASSDFSRATQASSSTAWARGIWHMAHVAFFRG